nr:SDR family oxidoreductase [uncultured Hyphomonas sp.]
MSIKTALVAGANGIIGKALIQELDRTPGWNARGLSRRPAGSQWMISCDLRNRTQTREVLARASATTHLFYAAYAPGGGLAEEDAVNRAMLRNLLDGLRDAGAPLKRVVLYQGAKIYGVHLGAAPAPFYEDDNPRHLGPNFYQSQQEELAARAAAGQLEWSILRPDVVIGDVVGNSMNIATVIGAFAALCRAQGAAFRFPGSERTYRQVLAQMTDADGLARASLWAATADAARGEAFNYVHEPFRWERIWTQIAASLDLEAGPPMPLSLARHMPLLAQDWERIAAAQHLPSVAYEKAVNWAFGDFVFSVEFDILSDMGKIRRAGFHETVDTGVALMAAIKRQQDAGILPR